MFKRPALGGPPSVSTWEGLWHHISIYTFKLINMIYFLMGQAWPGNKCNTLGALRQSSQGVIHIPNISFSSTPTPWRSYDRWVALAKKAGFSEKEVLDANTMGEFVVVDPMNKSALLALSGPAYQKLLGQVLARDDQSLILLLSPLDEKTPSTSDASGDNSQNSPNVPGFVTTLADLSRAVKEKRYVYKWQVYSQRQAFTAYAGIGATVTGSGLSFKTADELFAVIQRWSTRLIFWGGLAWRSRSRSEL